MHCPTGRLYTGVCNIGSLLPLLPLDHMVQPTLEGYHSNGLLAIPGEYLPIWSTPSCDHTLQGQEILSIRKNHVHYRDEIILQYIDILSQYNTIRLMKYIDVLYIAIYCENTFTSKL